MRYFLIAGEASGDLHSSNLVSAIREKDKHAEFRAWGGDLMAAEGVEVLKHYRELDFMGFTEVLMNLRSILKNFRQCKADIQQFKPDAVILVDYPGFNLRMAKWLHESGIPVIYYISPQVWAWKQSRVKKIKRFVDRMLVILPFEQAFYAGFDYGVDFVGHPLLDAIRNYREEAPSKEAIREEFSPEGKPVVSLLPGSRKQEVGVMLPVMLGLSRDYPEYQFVVGEASSLEKSFYDEICAGYPVMRARSRTYDLLSVSHAAAVTSGTASLETALFGVPEVICYKGSKISYEIARRIVRISYIGLANLIMDRSIIKELIQDEMSYPMLKAEMHKLLFSEEYRSGMKEDFAFLREKLGGTGASSRAAGIITDYLAERK